jgi:hypothetical protein
MEGTSVVRHARRLLLALVTLLCAPHPAWSWGNDGHHVVGTMADLLLEQHPTTHDKVRTILGGASLAEATVWADCAKGFVHCQRDPTPEEKAFTQRNPRHRSFHYTNVPVQQPEYRAGTAGTASDDIVQVLEHAVSVLRGQAPASGPAVLDQQEALWLIAHLVGDIHQPLHVGAIYFDEVCQTVVDPNVVGMGLSNFGIDTVVASITGGNALKLGSGNLHTYWDSGTVKGAMRAAGVRNGSVQDFALWLVNHPPVGWEMSDEPSTWPARWASEILPLAKTALSRVTVGAPEEAEDDPKLKCTWPVVLEPGYGPWANQQALVQLGKAGFRLAALLRAALENR